MERADEILPGRDVDRGLPPDAGVAHRQECRRDVGHAYATQVRGADDPREVPDAAAAERDDAAIAADALARERIPEPRGDRKPLGALARGDAERDRLEPHRGKRSRHGTLITGRGARLVDERDPSAPAEVGQVGTDVGEDPSADEDARWPLRSRDID